MRLAHSQKLEPPLQYPLASLSWYTCGSAERCDSRKPSNIHPVSPWIETCCQHPLMPFKVTQGPKDNQLRIAMRNGKIASTAALLLGSFLSFRPANGLTYFVPLSKPDSGFSFLVDFGALAFLRSLQKGKSTVTKMIRIFTGILRHHKGLDAGPAVNPFKFLKSQPLAVSRQELAIQLSCT